MSSLSSFNSCDPFVPFEEVKPGEMISGLGVYLKSDIKTTLEELGINPDFTEGLKWMDSTTIDDMSPHAFRKRWLFILNKKFMYEITYCGLMNQLLIAASGNIDSPDAFEPLKEQQKIVHQIAKKSKIIMDDRQFVEDQDNNGVIIDVISRVGVLLNNTKQINYEKKEPLLKALELFLNMSSESDQLKTVKNAVDTLIKNNDDNLKTLREILISEQQNKLALIHWARLVTAGSLSFQLERPSQLSDGAKPLLFIALKNTIILGEVSLDNLIIKLLGSDTKKFALSSFVKELRDTLAKNLKKTPQLTLRKSRVEEKESCGDYIIEGSVNEFSENKMKLSNKLEQWLGSQKKCIFEGISNKTQTTHPYVTDNNPDVKPEQVVDYISTRGYFNTALTLDSQCTNRYRAFKEEIVEEGLCNWQQVAKLCKLIDKNECIMGRGSMRCPGMRLDVEHLQEFNQFTAINTSHYQYVLAMMSANLNVGALTSNTVINELFKKFGKSGKTSLNINDKFNITINPIPTRSFMGRLYIQCIVDTDCLLYTSPSPRDRQKSRMPSSA